MNIQFLDFEKPIAELEEQKKAILRLNAHYDEDEDDEDRAKLLAQLEANSLKLTEKIFSKLTAWQVSQLARHPERPYTLDYIEHMFTEFEELSGDRAYGDDKAIVAGIARLDGHPIMVIGHQKGRDTKEKVLRNFGMPQPEGYRKALRLMKMAERFNIPIVTFIDTAGAYPGVGAEERGQSEAIATNLKEMSELTVPIICNVVGEGGSGGALAIGVGDYVNMLQYSTYSVISPEGCASILWRDSSKAEQAAEAMNMTADRLQQLGLIDEIIVEPLGGAHRDVIQMATNIKRCIVKQLQELRQLDRADLVARRYQRLMNYGYC